MTKPLSPAHPSFAARKVGAMKNQEIVDAVEDALTGRLPIGIREKILDAVWQVVNDENKSEDSDE